MTTDALDPARLDRVREALAAKPDGVLETVAAANDVPLLSVVECLPPAMWTRVPGERFVEVMQDVAGWGDIMVIVHTADAVFEFAGPLPGGSTAHGYYNLSGKAGLGGHLRAGNCRAIVFLRRTFMGKDSLSIQFFNAAGGAMFKIFVGRDESRRPKADQVARFLELEARLGAMAPAA